MLRRRGGALVIAAAVAAFPLVWPIRGADAAQPRPGTVCFVPSPAPAAPPPPVGVNPSLPQAYPQINPRVVVAPPAGINPSSPQAYPQVNPGVVIPPPAGVNPSSPQAYPRVMPPPSVLFLIPQPGTHTVVVPPTIPPATGEAPSLSQYELIIPGPNPAQNTRVNLQEVLNAVLNSEGVTGGGTVGGGAPAPALTNCF
jgi:hypothetical protein